MCDVLVSRLPHGSGLAGPAYATGGAAGLDLLAAIPVDSPVTIAAGGRASIPTGIAIALPGGFEAQVRPRSGLALKHGVTVLNSPGTVDADYRGEIAVLLINLGEHRYVVRRGDRVAQLVVAPVSQVRLVPSDVLPATGRSGGGFGSTGMNTS